MFMLLSKSAKDLRLTQSPLQSARSSSKAQLTDARPVTSKRKSTNLIGRTEDRGAFFAHAEDSLPFS
jgi:hypothetical protein